MLKEPNNKKTAGIIILLLHCGLLYNPTAVLLFNFFFFFFKKSQGSILCTFSDTAKANDGRVDTMMNSVAVFHAEIRWVMKVVTSHFSYCSCLNMNSLLASMFLDSPIAKSFQLSITKNMKLSITENILQKRPNADNVVAELLSFTASLSGKKMFVLYMNAPNTNWSTLEKLRAHGYKYKLPQILEIRSCGPYVVHGALQTGVKATGWELERFLKAL